MFVKKCASAHFLFVSLPALKHEVFVMLKFSILLFAILSFAVNADQSPQESLSEIEEQLQRAINHYEQNTSPWEIEAPKETSQQSSQKTSQQISQQTSQDAIVEVDAKLIQRLQQDMVWVEGGQFSMGTDSDSALKREQPAHPVIVDGFYIARTEMTQDLFEAVMGWNVSYFACDNCPINNISWFNIQLFIERLNKITGQSYRLPTEAEWAYAAKGGNKSKGYRYSGSNNIDDVAWYAGNADKRSHPVAGKKPNELGLFDMTGNLWEFCVDDMTADLYQRHVDRFGDKARVNPVNLVKDGNLRRKTMKVQRGSGYEFAANESEVFRRDGATNNVRMPDIGFRLALTEK